VEELPQNYIVVVYSPDPSGHLEGRFNLNGVGGTPPWAACYERI